jgi:hypothetical protein
MARLVTGGTYNPATGELVADGQSKTYVASDNLKAVSLIGVPPADVIAEIDRRGLAFDPAKGTGATLHLMGALRLYGKMGATCIAESAEEADALYEEVSGVLTGEG